MFFGMGFMHMLLIRDIERMIVEVETEMEFNLAERQGYLKGYGQQTGSFDQRLFESFIRKVSYCYTFCIS